LCYHLANAFVMRRFRQIYLVFCVTFMMQFVVITRNGFFGKHGKKC